jgi:DNA polymerase-3 subunit epsilon
VELGAVAAAAPAELEAALDAAVQVGPVMRLSTREIIRRHAGEAWAWVEGGRAGFRATLPIEEAAEPERLSPAAVSFVGAGTLSGFDSAVALPPRPDLYDFSFFEEMQDHVSPADRERRLDALTLVVLDAETTGLRPEAGDRIVSLAGVRVRGAAVKRGEVFDALVRPDRPIPASSVRFHGITDEMVAQAPPIDVVLPAFLRFADGAVLVGHEVWFDLRFLEDQARRLGLPALTESHAILDTRLLSELIHPAAESHDLDAVAQRLGVPLEGRHSALGDALTTAEVVVRLVELLRKRGIATLGQALAASRPTPRARSADRPAGGPRA